jgi:Mce-associated membrane protein
MTVPTKKRSVKVAGRHHEAADPDSREGETGAAPGLPRTTGRARWRWVFAAVAVVMAGLAGWCTLEARGATAVVAHNTALSDVAGTADAGKQVSAALGTLFSYRYDDPAKNEQAAKDLLAGPARAQYDQLFGEVRKLAADQKLVVTSTAVTAGVKLLDGDRAALLVFLDQTGTRGDGQHSTGAAQLSVTAERVAGKWRVTGMSAA